MTYVLGVDVGNTKTIALAVGREGTIVGAGRGGCGDIYDTTNVYNDRSPAAPSSVEDAVGTALGDGGGGDHD